MMLLLFLDNVRSERELMRIIPERLDYMWFLGYVRAAASKSDKTNDFKIGWWIGVV